MRWYFAIDEAGGIGTAGAYAKLAVLTARAAGGLEPVLLYYGNRTTFTEWMSANGVSVIDTAPSFLSTIKAAEAAGTYKAHSIGHWLRVAVPQVETRDEFVLYTDCDVLFLRPFDYARIRPKVFAAAPEFQLDNWNYFNAGVMVLNVPAMQKTYDLLQAHIIAHITDGRFFSYDDEMALNEAYRGFWDRLDPAFNWKPYWGFSRNAVLLHFHGPKIDTIEAITRGGWPRDNPTSVMLGKMLDAHADGYLAWCNVLGDLLQDLDFAAALRLNAAASALDAYRKTLPPITDRSFMGFRMFNN